MECKHTTSVTLDMVMAGAIEPSENGELVFFPSVYKLAKL